jgi:hypothetical protein
VLLKLFIKPLVFSNIFYGCCAVALSVETFYQQQIQLTHWGFYLFIFCTTTLYYTYAYLNQYHHPNLNTNERANWYFSHRKQIIFFQLFLLLLSIILLTTFLCNHFYILPTINYASWFLLSLFLLLSILYYVKNTSSFQWLALRNYGLVKPFLIAFIWAGTVSILPILYDDLTQNNAHLFTYTTLFLFSKNWLFISVLCILFDIKDYAEDYNVQLKTFVVRLGLRKTLFSVVLPLACFSWLLFVALGILAHFAALRILLNTIPFILLITVCYTMYQRKSILYYLAIIDGLMLVKAFCGIAGIILTK